MVDYKNKKVLVMGLGLLGGGVAVARWFVKHGAVVTVTDLKSEKELAPSIKSLGRTTKKIKLVLGEHREQDFRENDFIIVNPGVPKESRFLQIAKASGKTLVNEALLFFNNVSNPITAITGTKGKTTTANWIAHLMRGRWKKIRVVGNSSKLPFLAVLDQLKKQAGLPVVAELSSWHLEFLNKARHGPNIAVVTNIMEDHLNRYESIKEYAIAKANIFKNQKTGQFLILNYNDRWTRFFLDLNPQAKIYFFSKEVLLREENGLWVEGGIWFQNRGVKILIFNEKQTDLFKKSFGEHNLQNLLAAILAARLAGLGWKIIKRRIGSLPQAPFREQIVMKKPKILIVNDSAATAPKATIAALKRFGASGNRMILIAGGADKNLSFKELAEEIKKRVDPKDIYLIEGSATEKIMKELSATGISNLETYTTLELLMRDVAETLKNRMGGEIVLLFSPAATSFEKFKNEFDRGEVFNKLVRKILK